MINGLLQFEPVAIGYWAPFLVATLVCFLAVGRAAQVDAPEVRRGLVWLLGTTGSWALFKVGYFLLPQPFKSPAYIVGLVFGFATIWVWLYFCSAYTGRSYHQHRTLRRLGAGIFLGIVAVKLTNPIHGLYFEATFVSTPFEYLAIEHGVFHWAVTGFSYVLATTGLFMLFELYAESGYDTRPLAGLTVLLGVPVLLDLFAVLTGAVIDIIYAPLGVAAFTVGVLYVYERRFLAVQSTGEADDATIFLDAEDRIRDYTPAAAEFFPALDGASGQPLRSVIPAVAETTDSETRVLEYESDGQRRYLLTTRSTVSLGDSTAAVLFLSDITSAEKRRRELARHNQQLEGFANALAHELRNILQIIDWRLGIARQGTEPGSVTNESIRKADEASDRLTGLVDDFTTLAKYGQTVEQVEPLQFGPAVEDAWSHAEPDELALAVDGEGRIEADAGRLQELLRNVFVFARLNGARTVTVELLDDGFAIAGDGDPPGENPAGYLTFGESIPSAEAGMKLPNAKTFARAHGWSIEIDTAYYDGVRIVVRGARVERTEKPTPQPES
ncbi:MAG: histidine kinase N-terminal 7TM domain-containing protein [Halovenus sp.]